MRVYISGIYDIDLLHACLLYTTIVLNLVVLRYPTNSTDLHSSENIRVFNDSIAPYRSIRTQSQNSYLKAVRNIISKVQAFSSLASDSSLMMPFLKMLFNITGRSHTTNLNV